MQVDLSPTFKFTDKAFPEEKREALELTRRLVRQDLTALRPEATSLDQAAATWAQLVSLAPFMVSFTLSMT
jgi:hypothetical protein